MRRLTILAGAALALAACSAGMSGGGSRGVPSQYIGTWTGTGTQSDQPGVEWSIEITLVGGPAEQVGTIRYPSLHCGGVLLFRSAGANWLEMLEDITYGDCVDQGTITLSPGADGGLTYDWRMEGSELTAHGELRRAGT